MSGAAESLSDNPTNEFLVPIRVATPWSDPVKHAALMMDFLGVLFSEDVADHDGTRQREYKRLVPTYAVGLRLQADERLRNEFYQHTSWKTHIGRRPRPSIHGADNAMHFAVARVIGGVTRERNQRASMIGSALSYLAVQGVAQEDLVNEIEKIRGPTNRSGLKHLAALEAQLRKNLEPRGQECDESLDAENTAPVKPQTVRVRAPALLAGRLLPNLYLVVEGSQILLSVHPHTLVPVDLVDGPT